MATKQELEEQIVKLQSDLAAALASSGADSEQSARVLDLEGRLKAADEHCTLLENELENARANVSERDNSLEALSEELRVAQSAVLSQETEIKALTEKLKNLPDPSKQEVISRGRMVDLVDQWRKKEINDDAEVAVLKNS